MAVATEPAPKPPACKDGWNFHVYPFAGDCCSICGHRRYPKKEG